MSFPSHLRKLENCKFYFFAIRQTRISFLYINSVAKLMPDTFKSADDMKI